MQRAASVAFLTCAFGLASQALAAPITFTHEGSGAGTLGGVPFSTANFVITAVGDTDDRGTIMNGWSIGHSLATISIDGVGDFEFLTSTWSLVNNNNEAVGFGLNEGRDLFIGPFDSAFSDWYMLSGIGPINGSGSLIQWSTAAVDTTGGVLVFEEDIDLPVTFTAQITAAPCPADLNGNGSVGFEDLQALLQSWGPCPAGPCPADIGDDGAVGFDDLQMLLQAWGACP